jgi:dipeptidyl aminopeptidase/acylaminoacyl peptidase
MKKLCLWVLLLAFIPVATSAFTYNYYKPLSNTENSLLISWGPFGSLENYNCSLTGYSCKKTDLKSFPANPDLKVENDQAWYSPDKDLVIYKATEKTLSEKITRYYVSLYEQNQWTPGRQLSITDDIQKIYWPTDYKNEAVFTTNPDSKGKRDFVRFNLGESKETSRISVADYVTNGTLSPNGLWLAYYVPLEKGTKSTVLLNLLAEAKEYRFDYTAPKNWELLTDENRLVAFSPDSTRFAFLEDSNGFSTIRLANLKDIQALSLASAKTIGTDAINTALDIWFPDNDTLLFSGNDRRNTLDWYLYSYDLAAEKFVSVIPDIAYMYEIRPVGQKILLGRLSGPNLVPAIYDPKARKYHELDLERSAGNSGLSKEVVTFKNGLNGVLIKNKGLRTDSNTPMVIWLHGGPFRQIGKEYHSYPSYAVYDWVLDQLAAQGAVILKVDYAGSWGYGNDTAYDVVNNVGKNDADDVYDAFNAIEKKLDFKGKVYLMGNSYGGYLGPRMLAAYPNDFDGAIAINGVFEWRTLLNYLRTSLFNVHFNGLYDPNDSKIYDQASITAAIKKLTPKQQVVIINGMADTTINPDQAYTFYELLKTAGKNAKIVSIPEENHIFAKVSSIETICKTAAETLGLELGADSCRFK